MVRRVPIRNMNPTFHWVQSAMLVPLRKGEDCSLFNILAIYEDFEPVQVVHRVYVPAALARHFDRGVKGFHLEILERNRGATIALGDQPQLLLVGVIDADGSSHSAIPPEWLRRRTWLKLLLGCGLVGFAVLMLAEHRIEVALGGLLTYLVIAATRAVKEVTVRPFFVSRGLGRQSTAEPHH